LYYFILLNYLLSRLLFYGLKAFIHCKWVFQGGPECFVRLYRALGEEGGAHDVRGEVVGILEIDTINNTWFHFLVQSHRVQTCDQTRM